MTMYLRVLLIARAYVPTYLYLRVELDVIYRGQRLTRLHIILCNAFYVGHRAVCMRLNGNHQINIRLESIEICYYHYCFQYFRFKLA